MYEHQLKQLKSKKKHYLVHNDTLAMVIKNNLEMKIIEEAKDHKLFTFLPTKKMIELD
jgi:hypothetical protein